MKVQLKQEDLKGGKTKVPVYPITTIDAVRGDKDNSLIKELGNIRKEIAGRVPAASKVTWQQLKDMRDNSQLVPGALYRITDYTCTTTQNNTKSAGHQFDIVLLALSENKLAEEGWAMLNESNIYDVTFSDGVTKKCWIYILDETQDNKTCNLVFSETKFAGLGAGDLAYGYVENSDYVVVDEENKTAEANISSLEMNESDLTYNYFQNSKLEAWKVWYCLDNDKSRFAWASDVARLDYGGEFYKRKPQADEQGYYAWEKNNDVVYTQSLTPQQGDTLFIKEDGEFIDDDLITGYIPEGTGVIYRLIDEYNNDVCYDFKNIMYKRTVNSNNLPDLQAQNEEYLYTFTDIDNDDNLAIKDASITAVQKVNDEGARGACVDNLIQRGSSYAAHGHISNNSDLPSVCIAKGTSNNDSTIQYSSIEIVGSYGVTLPIGDAINLHIYNSETVTTDPENFEYLENIFILWSSAIVLTHGDNGNFIVMNQKASLVNR